MSNNRTQRNESLVGGGETGGPGNAAVGPARSTTRSGVSYAATDDLGSKQPVRMTEKSTSEWRTGAEMDKTVHGSKSQFSGASSSSRTRPNTAKRATGAMPLEYTNSTRKKLQLSTAPKSALMKRSSLIGSFNDPSSKPH